MLIDCEVAFKPQGYLKELAMLPREEKRVLELHFFFIFQRIVMCQLFTAFLAYISLASFAEPSARPEMNSFTKYVLNVHCIPDTMLGT